jgi:transcriptional regulator GlxA family with amidase domain
MDFTVAVLEGALSSSVAITLDALTAASRLSNIRGGPSLHWRIIGSSTDTLLSSGMRIATTPISSRMRLGSSILLVPGIAITAKPGERYDPVELMERMQQEDAQTLARLATHHHQRGGTVAAGCSAAFLLAHAGLLKDRSATTHWRLAGYLQQQFPDCQVDSNRIVIENDRIITAGAALAQMDLMLCLVRKTLGVQVAELTMKYLLLDERTSQAGYMVWSHLGQRDSTVKNMEELIERSLPHVPPLSQVAKELHISEKTLARRVHHATGKSSQDLVQGVRLRRARHLLASTRLSLEEIAIQVGYADATALRKLTRKIMGTTPGRLRAQR